MTMIKSPFEIAKIRQPGRIIEKMFSELEGFLRPGISSLDIDSFCGKFIIKHGGVPALNGFQGYKHAVCVSINNTAVHGLPAADVILKAGDICTVDTVVQKANYHNDGAWTYCIGSVSSEKRNVTTAAWKCLLAGIDACIPGTTLNQLGRRIESTASLCGCNIIESCLGHGIGRELHEPPRVPHASGGHDAFSVLQTGMVITIEPVVTREKSGVIQGGDEWSMITERDIPAAQFESTILIGKEYAENLTFSENIFKNNIDFPYHFI